VGLECCQRKTPFFNDLKDGWAIYARVLADCGDRFPPDDTMKLGAKTHSRAVQYLTLRLKNLCLTGT
jgi:hypothetical protein